MRYKVWRSNKDKELHLLFREGPAAFNALPTAIRHLGPWSGSKEGDVDRLRLPLRLLLTEQAFVLLHGDVSKLVLETSRAQKLDRFIMRPADRRDGGLRARALR